MPSPRRALPSRPAPVALAILSFTVAAACASARWPDEPGTPVAVSRAANLQAAEDFFETLTARRRQENQPPPVPVARLQPALEKVAEALQRGELSAGRARDEAERVARDFYKRDVEAWVLDCAAGGGMALPGALVSRATVAIGYAGAHFHPRSATADQCGLIVVAVTGAVEVRLEAP